MTIASEITRLQGAKADIRQAIIDKGVDVSSSLTLDDYAACIAAIEGAQKFIAFTVVGGGGNGSSSSYACGGGGGGGAVCHADIYGIGSASSLTVTVGGRGQQSSIYDDKGCCIVIAKGGCNASGTSGGASGSGCSGGGGGNCCGGGGGGASAAGAAGYRSGNYYYGGAGGAGLCGFGGGGAGSGSSGSGGATCGGGAAKGNATNYGGGGGGGGNNRDNGCGCQGVVFICYNSNLGINTATGGQCCYSCNGYCVHMFTSSGTFTITS